VGGEPSAKMKGIRRLCCHYDDVHNLEKGQASRKQPHYRDNVESEQDKRQKKQTYRSDRYNFTTGKPQPFYGPLSGTTCLSQCQYRTSGLYDARED